MRTGARVVRHVAVAAAAAMIATLTIGPASAEPPDDREPPAHGTVRPPGLAKQDTLR